MVAPRPIGPGLVVRRVQVATDKVALVRFLLEAEDGLGMMHGDGTQHISLLCPVSMVEALDRFIADLETEGLLVLAHEG